MRLLLALVLIFPFKLLTSQEIYIRINNIGYFPRDGKIALILSNKKLTNEIGLYEENTEEKVFSAKPEPAKGDAWGPFKFYYVFDFGKVQQPGNYRIKTESSRSVLFRIDWNVYGNYQEELLSFMRQQRCGYNPYFDVVCHPGDGRIFYAPVPDSTFYDFSGGWHDAGDQLKYLITASNATARMLMAYELAPDRFKDKVDELGHPLPNGIPDVLDEAKWGLEWILKLHPRPDWLVHQVADDRDHQGFKYPDRDDVDYGWGENTYRPAYFANGKPQGLGKWKSRATGIANLAGRCAAALALGSRIWNEEGLEEDFSLKCRKAAVELYELGLENEGYQQGNSYGAPYRYHEDSWTDDMEWGAAELFKLTRKKNYLEDAIRYAKMSREDGWMARDSMMHYQLYPFMNMGHFSLYELVQDPIKAELAVYFKTNIEKVLQRATTNTYQIGVPFLWCSNNLMVNFITQVKLYERMTGDMQYHDRTTLHRDWLFGYNPWGTSMFTGIPENGETPEDVHLSARALNNDTPQGGLVDGPVYRSIYDKLKGLTLHHPDEFHTFQNDFVVYHDDIGDYSTNEPTMDGTADAILLVALWSMGY